MNKICTMILLVCITLPITAKENIMQYSSGYTDGTYTPQGVSIIPPSPISQVYQRFMGFQPTLYTGAVNVTIPLHTIAFDNFTLPLNLNYQSNGIKIDDPYYPLGYGWSLHPGLRITRTVMGKADESAYDKDVYSHIFTDDCYFNNLTKFGRFEDSHYDVFTLCLPTGNISFLVESNGSSWSAITVGNSYKIQPLKKYLGGYFYGFEVLDENGITYYFGDEQGPIFPSSYIERSNHIPTTYLLRKVILPGNKIVDFTWEVNENSVVGEYKYCYTLTDEIIAERYDSEEPYFNFDDGPKKRYDESLKVDDSVLTKITFPNGQINFYYSGDVLSSISIDDHRYKSIKNISFEINDRLLQKVCIGDEKYTFHYNEQRFSTNNKAKDFWGYCNGKDDNYYDYPTVQCIERFQPLGSFLRTISISGANRISNEYFMKANILERIDYPTGGYTCFEYEMHRYEWNREIHSGGGLRVKKITSCSNASEEERKIIKTYRYGNNNNLSKCTLEPNETTFITEEFYEYNVSPEYQFYRQRIVHPNSVYSNYFIFNLPIWCDYVTEFNTDGSRTEYKYDYQPDAMTYLTEASIKRSVIRDHPIKMQSEYRHIFDKVPRLVSKEDYDATGKNVYSEKRTYQMEDNDMGKQALLAINHRQVYTDLTCRNPLSHCSSVQAFDYTVATVRQILYDPYMVEKTEDGVKTVVTTHYDHKGRLSETRTLHSDSTFVKEEYLYADNDLSKLTVMQRNAQGVMKLKNRVALPIRVCKSINDSIVSQQITQYTYKNDGDCIVPETVYYSNRGYREEPRISYPKYNVCGKPAYVIVDNQKSVYLWGYASQYPIAKIENATYGEVENILGDSLIANIANEIVPDEESLKIVSSLRSLLPHAMVYTYTYQPLVGMISETDPTGMSIFYTYDQCGRLKEKYRMVADDLKMQRKELIESYEYHYKNM